MSNLFSIFNTSASALMAQSVRLNTVASNLANANVVGSSPEDTYRKKEVVFEALVHAYDGPHEAATPVVVRGVIESPTPPYASYEPNHPKANEEGYVFRPAITVVEEMANMMTAARNYEANVEVMNTTKSLLQRTLQMGA